MVRGPGEYRVLDFMGEHHTRLQSDWWDDMFRMGTRQHVLSKDGWRKENERCNGVSAGRFNSTSIVQKRRRKYCLGDISDNASTLRSATEVFDEEEVDMREAQVSKDGVMSGKSLAIGFNMLRSNDLIWSYVVNNYLKGKTPPPFDLLYWNSDPTNLPATMYNTYIREMYVNNSLSQPGGFTCCDKPVELNKVKTPMYFRN